MMTSCLGPQAFFHRPMISIGTASGSVPVNTVQAVACMPGFNSEDFMIWTGPALGGLASELPANMDTSLAANARIAAAIRLVIFESDTPCFDCTIAGGESKKEVKRRKAKVFRLYARRISVPDALL